MIMLMMSILLFVLPVLGLKLTLLDYSILLVSNSNNSSTEAYSGNSHFVFFFSFLLHHLSFSLPLTLIYLIVSMFFDVVAFF